ncbi:hypothetical protein [Mesorhizobium sp. INR15]|uniref:hypothetical protein n=1 Tax=Mesorhizobium sp. INR15 TaxID=2654248 RepID=UPI00189648A1|nr:hypothetical protein [Mesorhizobium sp. INR15]QPC90309.1 hypothetical protein GA829_06730 [Mesorhizobium sp. INR15]
MARTKRHERISEYHLALIDRAVFKLRVEMQAAQLALLPFRAHYDALDALHSHLRGALNLLNDRPAGYEEPHRAPMSGGG